MKVIIEIEDVTGHSGGNMALRMRCERNGNCDDPEESAALVAAKCAAKFISMQADEVVAMQLRGRDGTVLDRYSKHDGGRN